MRRPEHMRRPLLLMLKPGATAEDVMAYREEHGDEDEGDWWDRGEPDEAA